MAKAGWTSKLQQRTIDTVQNKLRQSVKEGRMEPVPLGNLRAQSDIKTRGAQVGFQVTSLQGIDHFVLLRNFSRDPGSAQQLHVWPADSLKSVPQAYPINLQHTDADSAIAGKKAYYWVKAVPLSDQTVPNSFLSGPQLFDASGQPPALAISGDTSLYQVYTATTQPLSSTTGGAANQALITIAPFQIQYPFDINQDGVPDLVSYNGGSITPLLDATTYFIYFDDPTYTGGAQSYIATTQSPDVVSSPHRQYVGSITTPAFGAGGTGGGNIHCFSGNTRIWTRRGVLPIQEAVEGDYVMTRAGWREIAEILSADYSGPMHDMGRGELVRAEHRFWENAGKRDTPGTLKFARDLFPKTVPFSGKVFNLALPSAKSEKAHLYLLGNGWFVHNQKMVF